MADKTQNASSGGAAPQQAQAPAQPAQAGGTAKQRGPGIGKRIGGFFFGEKRQTAVAAEASGLGRKADGSHVKTLHDAVLYALRSGHAKGGRNEPAVMMREVLCREEFIRVLEARAGSGYDIYKVRTPMEQGNQTYEKDTVEKRERIANALRTAARNPDHVIEPFTVEAMEIIYATMMGNPNIWNVDAVGWPKSLPAPPDAFLRFVTGLSKSQPDRATFVADVFTYLATPPTGHTLTGGKEYTTDTIVNRGKVTEYIRSKSDAHIEDCVRTFEERVQEAAVTPANCGCWENGTPGWAEAKPEDLLAAAEQKLCSARSALADAEDEVRAKRREVDLAEAGAKAAGKDTAAKGAPGAAVQAGAETTEAAEAPETPQVKAVREAKTALVAAESAMEETKRAVASAEAEVALAAAPYEAVVGEYQAAKSGYIAAEGARIAAVQELADAEAEMESKTLELDAELRDATAYAKKHNGKVPGGYTLAEAKQHVSEEKVQLYERVKNANGAVAAAAQAAAEAAAKLDGQAFEPLRQADEITGTFRLTLIQAHDQADPTEAVQGKIGAVITNNGLERLCTKADAAFTKMMEAKNASLPEDHEPTKAELDDVKKLVEGGAKMEDAVALVIKCRPKRSEDVAGRENDFARELGEFRGQMAETPMPPAILGRFVAIADAMENRTCTPDDVDKLKRDMQTHVHPLNKAIECAVDEVKRARNRRYDDLTPFEWMQVRLKWEQHAGAAPVENVERTGLLAGPGKWWRDFKQGTVDFITDSDSRKEFFRKAWNGSFGDDIWLLRHARETDAEAQLKGHARPQFRKLQRRDPQTKAFVDTPIPKFVTTGAWVGVKALAVAYAAGTLFMPGNADYTAKPLGMKLHPFKHYFRWPWTYHQPLRTVHKFEGKIIDDTYSDPARVTKRSREEYAERYGLGYRLPGETDDRGIRKRLGFFRGHPDLARFMEEYTSGIVIEGKVKRKDSQWQTSKNTTRKIGGKEIPATCKDMGLVTEEQIAAFEVPGKDYSGYKSGGCVSCELQYSWHPMGDSTILVCKAMSDSFVSDLMERSKGARIDYAYLTRPENVTEWKNKRYLVPRAVANTLNLYGFRNIENLEFALRQGSDLHLKLLPLCVEGQAQWYIKKGNRDDFVALTRQKVSALMNGAEPRYVKVDEEVLVKALNQAAEEARAKGWIGDCARPYQRNVLRAKHAALGLNDESLDTLISQPAIDTLLDKFNTQGSAYKINPGMADAFVKMVSQYRAAGSVNDFDPLAEGSPKLGWAAAQMYITGGGGGTVPVAKTVAEVSADVQLGMSSFFGNAANQDVAAFVDGMLKALHTIKTPEGERFRLAQATRYNGDATAMDNAMKAAIYHVLSDTGALAAQTRADWGVTVTRENGTLVATMSDRRNAATGIKTRLLQLAQ